MTGNGNTCIGASAGTALLGGDENTLVGGGAGDSLTSGRNCTIIGFGADASAVGADEQIVLGKTIGHGDNKFTFGAGSASGSAASADILSGSTVNGHSVGGDLLPSAHNSFDLGSPTRFGSMASSLKYFLDSTGDLWASNSLEDKPGIVFTSTGSMHGGQETTLFNLMTYMLHHGMIVAGSPYSISELHKTKSGGTPYGSSHVESFNESNELTIDEYEIARKSGVRIANLIKKILNDS